MYEMSRGKCQTFIFCIFGGRFGENLGKTIGNEEKIWIFWLRILLVSHLRDVRGREKEKRGGAGVTTRAQLAFRGRTGSK